MEDFTAYDPKKRGGKKKGLGGILLESGRNCYI
jgi:hypothetical protein